MEMLDLHDFAIADVESWDGVELLQLVLLEERCDFEDFVIEGVDEELILLLFEDLPILCLFHELSEKKCVWSNLTILHQSPADGAGYWLIEANLKHILDADIAEKVSVGTG